MTKETDEIRTGGLRGWLCLVLAVLLIWGFVALLPQLERIPMVDRLHRHIRAHDIEAGALFYTETDQSAEAEQYLRHALDN